MAKFNIGDVIHSKDGVVIYEILGFRIRKGLPSQYHVKVLASRHPRRVGVTDFKDQSMIESQYELRVAASTAMHPLHQLPDIDLDEEMVKAMDNLRGAMKGMRDRVEAAISSKCDCGAHKCGYRDDELHGHATWCQLVTRQFRTQIINEEI